ncbi:hypothetical protein [Chitinimonas sp.]|uniref:hypothetical protein n=1 Tax=Chitinimonas sp. TaxID=1934313 RepID=UPI002F953D44
MKTVTKLISASLFGLALVQASASGIGYTDDVRRANAINTSEDAYNTQFVSPDNTDAFRATAARTVREDVIVVAGKSKVSPDNTDAFRRSGYTGADLLANSRTGRDAQVVTVAQGTAGVEGVKVASRTVREAAI